MKNLIENVTLKYAKDHDDYNSIKQNQQILTEFYDIVHSDQQTRMIFHDLFTEDNQKIVFQTILDNKLFENSKEMEELRELVNELKEQSLFEENRDGKEMLWLEKWLIYSAKLGIFIVSGLSVLLVFLLIFTLSIGIPIGILILLFSMHIGAGVIGLALIISLIITSWEMHIIPKFKLFLETLNNIKFLANFKNFEAFDTKIFKARRDIIFGNFNNCRAKCGLDRELKGDELKALKIAVNNFFKNKENDEDEIDKLKSWVFSEKIKSKIECLVKCALDALSTLYAELVSSYINCMNNSGSQITELENFSNAILLKYPTNNSCALMYKELRDAFDSFENILNVVYKNDATELGYWYKEIDRKVREVQRGTHLRPGTYGKIGFNRDHAKITTDINQKRTTIDV